MSSPRSVLEWKICLSERHQMLLGMYIWKYKNILRSIQYGKGMWDGFEVIEMKGIHFKFVEGTWVPFSWATRDIPSDDYGTYSNGCSFLTYTVNPKHIDYTILSNIFSKELEKEYKKFEYLVCQYAHLRCNNITS